MMYVCCQKKGMIQVTGEAKASHTLDKLEIYVDHRFRPLDSSHVDLCLILLRC
jgi:hypothetical protein